MNIASYASQGNPNNFLIHLKNLIGILKKQKKLLFKRA